MHTHICFRSCALLTLTLCSIPGTYSIGTKKTIKLFNILRPRCGQRESVHVPFIKVVKKITPTDPDFLAGIVSGNNQQHIKEYIQHLKMCVEKAPEYGRGDNLHIIVKQAEKNFMNQPTTKEEQIGKIHTLLSLRCDIVGIRRGKKGFELARNETSFFAGVHNYYIVPADMKQKLIKIKPWLIEALRNCDNDGELTVVNKVFDKTDTYPSMILVLNIEELRKKLT